MRPHPILLIGASVRAAAWSARRAGLDPIGFDLFADRDLSAVAPSDRIHPHHYPDSFPPILSKFPPDSPVFYTGALENHPTLIDSLTLQRPLWGIGSPSLHLARNPFHLAKLLSLAGFPTPPLRPNSHNLPRDGSWLQKPLASAGGRNILHWLADTSRLAEPSCFQQHIPGLPLSAVYLANPTSVELLGVTLQLLGRGGSPFAYQGSCGPVPLEPAIETRFQALGEVLASELNLLGIFGLDVVFRDGEPWLIEINPRYPASAEVLELASGRSLLAAHARVFEPDFEEPPIQPNRPPVVARMILDAPVPLRAGDWPSNSPESLWSTPEVADVPEPGTPIRPGEPVLTVFAEGADGHECLSALRLKARQWTERISQGQADLRPTSQPASVGNT